MDSKVYQSNTKDIYFSHSAVSFEPLTYLISVPFFIYLKILPVKHPYLKQLKGFNLHHTHCIIFDQLLPTIAEYYKKEEAENLLKDNGLNDVKFINATTIAGR